MDANYWKRVVALLFLGWLVIWVYRTMLTPVYEEIQLTIGSQTGVAMGLISSCYFFGYVAAQIPGGILMDKIGRRTVLVPCFLTFSLGILVIGLARNIEMIYLGSVLAGVSTGTYYSGAFSLSGTVVPKQHKFVATAIVNNGCAFGMIIGLVLSSYLVKQAQLPWQALVFAVAILAAATSPLFGAVLKKDGPKARAAEMAKAAQDAQAAAGEAGNGGQANGGTGAAGSAPAAQPVKINLFKAPLVATYLFYFATCYGYYMIITWLPSFLEQERGITGTAVGLAASIVAAISIPGALLFGKLADKFQKHKIVFLTLLQFSAAAMLVLAATVQSIAPLMVALALYGLTGKQTVDPLIVPHVTDLNAGGKLSTGLGVFNFFGMSSSIFAPFLTGLISDVTGSRVLGFFVAAGLLCLSSILFFILNRGNAKKTHAQA